MARRKFNYYCAERQINVLIGDAVQLASYYVGLRLEDMLLYDTEVQKIVGLIQRSDILATRKAVTVDIERTFHCASSKKVFGHLVFMLIAADETQEYPPWGKGIETSIAYNKTINFAKVESDLYEHKFKPQGSEAVYFIVPGSIKERTRRGER